MTIESWDIINSETPEWKTVLELAKNDHTHPLSKNYQNINIKDYESMIIYRRDHKPAGFHGIYNNGRWPNNISRICNRAWLDAKYRDHRQGAFITSRNIKFVLDRYDVWQKDVLFISRGVQYDDVDITWNKFKNFCEFIKKHTGYNLIYDDRLYQCCKNHTKDCFQFCVWFDPKNLKSNLPIESLTREEWKSLTD